MAAHRYILSYSPEEVASNAPELLEKLVAKLAGLDECKIFSQDSSRALLGYSAGLDSLRAYLSPLPEGFYIEKDSRHKLIM